MWLRSLTFMKCRQRNTGHGLVQDGSRRRQYGTPDFSLGAGSPENPGIVRLWTRVSAAAAMVGYEKTTTKRPEQYSGLDINLQGCNYGYWVRTYNEFDIPGTDVSGTADVSVSV